MKIYRYISILIAIAIFSACSSPTSPEEPESPWWEPLLAQQDSFSKDTSPLEMSLTLSDHKLSVDDTLKMTLDIHNTAEDTVYMVVGGTTSGIVYHDFVVLQPDTSLVWSWLYSNHPVEYTSARRFHISPDEVLTFEKSWGLRTGEGDQIEEGIYKIFGGFRELHFSIDPTESFDMEPVATEMQEIVIE